MHDFDEAAYPRCLTRSGVVPKETDIHKKKVRDIHIMMIKITTAVAECPLAQRQHEAARRETGRARRNHAYKTLREELAGEQQGL